MVLLASSIYLLIDETKTLYKLPDGRDSGGKNWLFLWWVGSGSVKFYPSYLPMGGVALPP